MELILDGPQVIRRSSDVPSASRQPGREALTTCSTLFTVPWLCSLRAGVLPPGGGRLLQDLPVSGVEFMAQKKLRHKEQRSLNPPSSWLMLASSPAPSAWGESTEVESRQ